MIAAATLLTVGVLVAGSVHAPASAQVDDPYATTSTTGATTTTTTDGGTTTTTTGGGTTTTTTGGGTTTTTTGGATTTTQPGDPACQPSIEISFSQGPSGTRVRVTAQCFPPGAQVSFTFNGRVVGTDAADQTQVLGASYAQMEFDIPAVAPGVYPVCAFTDGIAPVCTSFEVLAAGASRSTAGTLVRTGIAAAGLVALAVSLMLAGRFLRVASRRRGSRV